MSLRLFAAVPLPDDVAAYLLGQMGAVPSAAPRPRENLHLTLRFFGEVVEPVADEIAEALDDVANSVSPFELQVKGVGSFGGEFRRTLWAGVGESASLKQLAADCERVARRCGLKPEGRKFAPHITLAYIAATDLAAEQAFAQRLSLLASAPFWVEGFALYASFVRKSGPSLYREEASYELRG